MFYLLSWGKTEKRAGDGVESREQSGKEVLGRKDSALGVLGNIVFHFHFLFFSFGTFRVGEDLRHSGF